MIDRLQEGAPRLQAYRWEIRPGFQAGHGLGVVRNIAEDERFVAAAEQTAELAWARFAGRQHRSIEMDGGIRKTLGRPYTIEHRAVGREIGRPNRRIG